MPGRKATPTHLKLVTGNPGKRPINVREPKAPPGMPERPKHLTGAAARAAWARFGKLLLDIGVLTQADGAALERLAETYVEVVELQRAITAHGRVYVTYSDTPELDKEGRLLPRQPMYRARPEVAMHSDADRRLRAVLSDFGLNPAARSKITVGGSKEKDDPAAKYFGS